LSYCAYEAASELVTRATKHCWDKDVQFLHDRGTIQHVVGTKPRHFAVLGHVSWQDVKTCLLIAEDGWPVEPFQVDRVKELMKLTTYDIEIIIIIIRNSATLIP
jgi:hypothetical protein